MIKPKLADGTIVKVCRTLYGTRLGGVSALYKPVSPDALSPRWEGNASEEDFDGANLKFEQLDSTECDEWMEPAETLDARIADLGRRLTERASRHLLIRRHLAINLRKMDTLHAKIKVPDRWPHVASFAGDRPPFRRK
jgi:hypothetical protein